MPKKDTFNKKNDGGGGQKQRHRNVLTKLPTENELANYKIGEYMRDTPRTYQLELYNAAVFSNTALYLPRGAGKNLVVAMLAACMRNFNSKKRVIVACDIEPRANQWASYLRNQTGMNVAELYGGEPAIVASRSNADIMVVTCDYLKKKLCEEEMFMEDCSCLIIDELHHARQNDHPLAHILLDYYFKIANKSLRPRILGRKSFNVLRK
jgi:ERCC4-related helicase